MAASVKSSCSSAGPIPGRWSGVGIMMRVAIGVGVLVAGNHSIVSVGMGAVVAVDVLDSSVGAA